MKKNDVKHDIEKLAEAQARGERVDEPTEAARPATNIFQDVSRWVTDEEYHSPTLADGQDSRRTLELVLAVYESARDGKAVTLRE